MAHHTIDHQEELGYGTAEDGRRRERAELLRRAGVRPARNPEVLARTNRKVVKPYPKWLLRLARLIP